MLDDAFSSDRRPRCGPMVVVCPELAMNGPLDRVADQATAFSNWNGPVFFLGGDLHGLAPERPWQVDYLNAVDAMVAAGAGRQVCGPRKAGLIAGTRMMADSRIFRAASGGKHRPAAIAVTGAIAEAHVAIVLATLRDCGFFPVRSSTVVACQELRRSQPRRLSA